MAVRAFLAIDLPRELKAKLKRLNPGESPGLKVKWVEEENFHLTLRFLGEVEESFLTRLYKELASRIKDFEPFDLRVQQVGFFGKKTSPRVVWIGLEDSETLHRLVVSLNKGFKKLGLPFPKEKFHPHITLFRVRHISTFSEFEEYFNRVKSLAQGLEGLGFLVKELTFFKSTLTSKGPIYETLYKLELKNGK
jgi:2'-5' RNA ligase